MDNGLNDVSDDELMIRIAKKDEAAFNELYRRWRGSLHHVLCRKMRIRSELANEVIQDTFMRVYFHAEKYSGGDFFRWIIQVARNLARDYFRKNARLMSQVNMEAYEDGVDAFCYSTGLSPNAAMSNELSEVIQAAIDRLPQEQKEVFLLYSFGGLNLREIADQLHIPYPTSKSRLRLAREKITERLLTEKQWHEDDLRFLKMPTRKGFRIESANKTRMGLRDQTV